MAKKQIPTGVKIIAVLSYIGAILGVLFGVLFFIGAGAIKTKINQVDFLGFLGPTLFVIGGIIFIGLGVIGFFVGRGLWKGQNWARIVAIVFAGLGILGAVTSMIKGDIASNISGLIINSVIAGYLAFSKSVKATFP
ncbi:MAG: DUF2127 domain-containing protein [Nanoarchaeota archaeon]|nr:DUF2127 domain-containing protein [Nanoarchaeota archaeon]